MCGIVGAVATGDVVEILIEGLKRLEYRGYDSAGIAVMNALGHVDRIRTKGRVDMLVQAVAVKMPQGTTGIAHTRWATHGAPSEKNAHPHMSSDEIALVHNGIIENYAVLRERLIKENYGFTSETDTEVITHLLHFHLKTQKNLRDAMRVMITEITGAFAIAALHTKEPSRLVAARRGSPLVLGIGTGELFIASDPIAIAPVTRRICYLEEGDIVDIEGPHYTIYNHHFQKSERDICDYHVQDVTLNMGEYKHYMQKEIFDQPDALNSTLEGRVEHDVLLPEIFGFKAKDILPNVRHVQIVACGTSFYAGLAAKYWLEGFAGISCSVEVASEFRYRTHVVPEGSLFVTISQSGETADTLAALRYAKSLGFLASLCICNAPQSSLVRESDLVLLTRAGVEICVASTKAFTAQLTGLLLLSLTLAHDMPVPLQKKHVQALKALPRLVEEVLTLDASIYELAEFFVDKHHALFLGRGIFFPIALEGALKLKELSYIHAEAYPAGELKHGPLALVDNDMPVIAVAPNDELFDKLRSNLSEVRARGGELFVFTDNELPSEEGIRVFPLPTVPALLAPIVYVVPLQLLAYHVGVRRGTDVDKPRNLAKSVTVE